MFKLLLCLRYLRTRYIALASIISVTLGVATMIVVNSVMAGFREEMYQRLHGLLSDIVIRAHSLEGIYDPDALMAEVAATVGDDLAGMTATVQVPAMMSFQVNGHWITRQVLLTGIDEASYADVGDFGSFLLHPANRERLSFLLREGGYDDRLPSAGWEYRRHRIGLQREYDRQLKQLEHREKLWRQPHASATAADDSPTTEPNAVGPEFYPVVPPSFADEADAPLPPGSDVAQGPEEIADPFAARSDAADVFDAMTEQHPGIIVGMALASVRRHNAETGEADEHFLCLPGDDVRVTFPTAGTPPQAVSDTCTIVDFYECKMAEYDSTFAFVPLARLQQLRGMIDPMTGVGAVTAVQLKLVEGADLQAVSQRLQQRFPADRYPMEIQTWMQMQGPLMDAVQMETTILNILLFLIIAVAGFGILATFFMIVVEKTRDIGILKSLGAPSRGVAAIFLSYGLSLGVVGSGAGLILGLLFVWNINHVAAGVERLTGREVFNPDIYFLREIPTIVNPLTIGWIVVGAMIIAVLASVLPALRAARLRPVEALRYE